MSLLSRSKSFLFAAYTAVRNWFGELANPFEMAAQLDPVTRTATRTPGYGQQPTPMKRTRIRGKARPSGSKLARKAANGTIGLTH
jgi:hypothetical protein